MFKASRYRHGEITVNVDKRKPDISAVARNKAEQKLFCFLVFSYQQHYH